MSPLLITYLIGVGVMLFVGVVTLFASGALGEDMRPAVRLLLLTPVWPIAAIFGLYLLIMWAFDLEWRQFGP